jgi:hypothetical protein
MQTQQTITYGIFLAWDDEHHAIKHILYDQRWLL